jgi:hypothetical protein
VFAETLAARNRHPDATCADYDDDFSLHQFTPTDRLFVLEALRRQDPFTSNIF